jgi:hypothetical protein
MTVATASSMRRESRSISAASRRLSEQERADGRRQDRERLQRAAQELLSSDGWARWVRVRAMLHSYSLPIWRAGVIHRT